MLDFESDYAEWKALKLSAFGQQSGPTVIGIKNPRCLSPSEFKAIEHQCRQHNFALYRLQQAHSASKQSIRSLAEQIGMRQLDQHLCADNDSVSSLKIMNIGRAQGYIPYTRHALNWHTDGYYNPLDRHIRSFLLHCIRPALQGGENMFINHELIYIHLFEQDPALIAALRQADALTIPENIQHDRQIRPPQTGPVFYRDGKSRALQMRYTARSKSITWKNDAMLSASKKIIEALLQKDQYVTHYRLNSGEGIVCNNILHARSAFTNGNIPAQQRLIYRIRSYNRLFSQPQ